MRGELQPPYLGSSPSAPLGLEEVINQCLLEAATSDQLGDFVYAWHRILSFQKPFRTQQWSMDPTVLSASWGCQKDGGPA